MEITTITPFLDYYENLPKRTLRVIKCIPPEKMDWTHSGQIYAYLGMLEISAPPLYGLTSEEIWEKSK